MPNEPRRLSTRIQQAATTLVFLAAAGLYLLLAEGNRQASLDALGAGLTDTLSLQADRILGRSQTLRQSALFLSKTPPVQGIVRARANRGVDPRDRNSQEEWTRRLQEIFAAFLDAHPEYYQARYIGVADGGRELVRVERRDGRIAVAPEGELLRKGGRDYFHDTQALPAGQVLLSGMDLNEEHDQAGRPALRTLRAATPVFAPDGRLFGMVVVNLDLGALLDEIESVPVRGVRALITDDRGRYLAHPDKSRAFAFDRGRDERLDKDLPELATAYGQSEPDAPPLRALQMAGKPGFLQYRRVHFDPRQPPRFVLLAYLLPEEAAGREAAAARWSALGWSLLLAVVGEGLVLLVLRRLLSPMHKLSAWARELAAGNMDSPMPPLSGREVSALGGTLESLRDGVQRREHALLQLNATLDERVRERTARLRLAGKIIESTSEGIIVTDAEPRILSVNPAFTEITGYEAAEAIGQKPSLLRSEHQPNEFYRDMWASLSATGRWEGELWNRRKSGEAFLEWLTINRIGGENGEPDCYVGVFQDITQLRQLDDRIHHLAYHDALTGLPNRTLMEDRIGHAVDKAGREGSRLALLFLDLNRFKAINDTLGHPAGDELLKIVGQRLKATLRECDTVARMGGDEFVVLLEGMADPDHCANLAYDLKEAIHDPMRIAGHTIQVETAIGIALYPEDGRKVSDLMRHADSAMYAAKKEGMGCYRFFQPGMTEAAGRRLQLEMALRHAVERGQLELHYQPKVMLADGAVFGVEALVRWRHPEMGLVSPGDFIPVAEETGLILEVGDWVLGEACRQGALWRSRGLALPIAVNVSARQLRQTDLMERVVAGAARHGLPLPALEIELTESAVMADPEAAIGLLRKLREAGLAIAVDDFGTGYSSLAYLRRLPLDVIKIDRAFVMNADQSEEDAQIVRTIAALALSLGLEMVAEGVERPAQAELLRGIGCRRAQGYLYARPMPAGQLEDWLAARSRPGLTTYDSKLQENSQLFQRNCSPLP